MAKRHKQDSLLAKHATFILNHFQITFVFSFLVLKFRSELDVIDHNFYVLYTSVIFGENGQVRFCAIEKTVVINKLKMV